MFEARIFFQVLLDQVRDDFRVRLSDEAVVRFPESFFELEIVLDDSVVNNDNPTGAIAMRMCILFGGTTVRCPTRVTDSVGPV